MRDMLRWDNTVLPHERLSSMSRANLNELQAFVIIAREGSFTRAAAQLGVSQSAISHTMRALETRLGVRLLTRTTRSVSPTEAGQRLYQSMAPRFDEIEKELAAVTEFRDTPAGNIRISAYPHQSMRPTTSSGPSC